MAQVIAKQALRLKSEKGDEHIVAVKAAPQEIPDEFKADPIFNRAIQDGSLVLANKDGSIPEQKPVTAPAGSKVKTADLGQSALDKTIHNAEAAALGAVSGPVPAPQFPATQAKVPLPEKEAKKYDVDTPGQNVKAGQDAHHADEGKQKPHVDHAAEHETAKHAGDLKAAHTAEVNHAVKPDHVTPASHTAHDTHGKAKK